MLFVFLLTLCGVLPCVNFLFKFLICMACFTTHVYCQIFAIQFWFYFVTKRTLSDKSLLYKMFIKSPKSHYLDIGKVKKEYTNIQIVTKLIMPPAGLPKQGFKESSM